MNQRYDSDMYEPFKKFFYEDLRRYSKLQRETLIFWGKDDTATPPFTGEKIASLIQNSKFYLLDGDHYFFINHKDFIAGELMGD